MRKSDIHIVIGYSNKLCSEGLELLINLENGFTVNGVVPNSDVLKRCFRDRNQIDILIIEMSAIHKQDLKFISELIPKIPRIKVFVVSSLPRINLTLKFIESGISAYISKTCSKQELINALSVVSRGEDYFSPELTRNMVAVNRSEAHSSEAHLTDREREVLSYLVKCESNGSIAKMLGVSENTIKTHRRNIKDKFGVTNLIGMVRFACRANLIDHGDDSFCSDCPYCGN